jgi:hypothetical protein
LPSDKSLNYFSSETKHCQEAQRGTLRVSIAIWNSQPSSSLDLPLL